MFTCAKCGKIFRSYSGLDVHRKQHMRRTDLPDEQGTEDLQIGQMVLGSRGLMGKVTGYSIDATGKQMFVDWVYTENIPNPHPAHSTERAKDLIPIMKLTSREYEVLERHTASFSKGWTNRRMVMYGRRCKCHGVFYLGRRLAFVREHRHPAKATFRRTGELYALWNISGVKNILYLEGMGEA